MESWVQSAISRPQRVFFLQLLSIYLSRSKRWFNLFYHNCFQNGLRRSKSHLNGGGTRFWVEASSLRHRLWKHLWLANTCKWVAHLQISAGTLFSGWGRKNKGVGLFLPQLLGKKWSDYIKRRDQWWKNELLVDESEGKNPEPCRLRVGCSGVTQCIPQRPKPKSVSCRGY